MELRLYIFPIFYCLILSNKRRDIGADIPDIMVYFCIERYTRACLKNYMLGILYGQKTMETKAKNKKGISACDYGTACDNDNAGRLRNVR